MARFKYLGPNPPPKGVVWGPLTKIGLITKMQGVVSYLPVPPNTEFVIGEDIGYDITDQFSLQALDADPRYQRIV
jgi:hypothetical protein